MLVNERVLIIYPSDLFSVEFSSGISTVRKAVLKIPWSGNSHELFRAGDLRNTSGRLLLRLSGETVVIGGFCSTDAVARNY